MTDCIAVIIGIALAIMVVPIALTLINWLLFFMAVTS